MEMSICLVLTVIYLVIGLYVGLSVFIFDI